MDLHIAPIVKLISINFTKLKNAQVSNEFGAF